MVHLSGMIGYVEKVYRNGSILVYWADGSVNQWHPDEFHCFRDEKSYP